MLEALVGCPSCLVNRTVSLASEREGNSTFEGQ